MSLFLRVGPRATRPSVFPLPLPLLSGSHVSVSRRATSPSSTQSLPTRPRCRPVPPVSRSRPRSLMPCCPPLPCGNAAAHTRRPGADAGRPSHPPPCWGPFFLSCSRPSRGDHPRTPTSLFSPLPRAWARSKAAGRRPVPLSALLLLAHAQARHLPQSSLYSVHWPRTPGSPLPSLSSTESWPPVICSVSRSRPP
jgi:hypothetical protein